MLEDYIREHEEGLQRVILGGRYEAPKAPNWLKKD
jgi:hypothetical protein